MGTYTPSGLYKPSFPTETGWGDEVNANFDLMDRTVGNALTQWVNVKDSLYGAVGDGATDDTAAIQAAIDSLDDGTKVQGLLYFPPGVYIVNGDITVGDGTKHIAIHILGTYMFWEGQNLSGGAFLPSVVEIRQQDETSNTFVFDQSNSNAKAVKVTGVSVSYPAATSTGKAFHCKGRSLGLTLEGLAVEGAGTAVHYDEAGTGYTASYAVQSTLCRDVLFLHSDAQDVLITGLATLPQFERCYFEGGVKGFVTTSGDTIQNPNFRDCVFQAKSSYVFDVAGGITDATFTNCWWEGNSSHIFYLSVSNLVRAVFINPQVSHVTNHFLYAPDAGGRGEEISFLGGFFALTSSATVCTAQTAPTSTGNPGFKNLNVQHTRIAATTAFHGIHPSTSDATQLTVLNSPQWLDGTEITGSNIRYIVHGGAQSVFAGGGVKVDKVLSIGDTTADTSAYIELGKTATAAEGNLPRISQGSVLSVGNSNDLLLQARSTSSGIVFYTGNVPTRQMSLNAAGELEIEGAINHDGSTVGLFGVTPASRPSAYTQTYATASKTHSNPTAAALTVTDGAGTNDNTIGAITADASVIAAVQELSDEVNKLVTDLANTKQVLNSVIDDDQILGLKQ